MSARAEAAKLESHIGPPRAIAGQQRILTAAMTVRIHAFRLSAPVRRTLLILSVSLVAALAACGKKGPLEPAPGSPDAIRAEEAKKTQAAQPTVSPQIGVRRSNRPPPVTAPKGESFFLDFLL